MKTLIDEIAGAFTVNQRAQWLVLADQARSYGMTLDELYEQLQQEQDQFKEQIQGSGDEKTRHRRWPRVACPSCGKGLLVRVATGDKRVKVVGCKRCRYSEVMG